MANTDKITERRLADFHDELRKALKQENDALQESIMEVTDGKLETKAEMDGYYPLLHAGEASTIEGSKPMKRQFSADTSSFDKDIATGVASQTKVYGDGVVWNQLYPVPYDGNVASVPQGVEGHFYALAEFIESASLVSLPSGDWFDANGNAVTAPSVDGVSGEYVIADLWRREVNYGETISQHIANWWTTGSSRRQVTDMSLVFGMENTSSPVLPAGSPLTVAAWKVWVGEHQSNGWREQFEYCDGAVLGVANIGLVATQNSNLCNNGVAHLLGIYSESYYDGGSGYLYEVAGTHNGTFTFINEDGDTVAISWAGGSAPSANVAAKFNVPCKGWLTVGGYDATTYVAQLWSGKSSVVDGKGEPDEYEQGGIYRTLAEGIQVGRIYGKLNGTGDAIKIWEDGMMKGIARTGVRDVIDVNKGIVSVRVGKLQPKALPWSTYGRLFRVTTMPSGSQVLALGLPYVINPTFTNLPDKCYLWTTEQIQVRDESFNGDLDDFKASLMPAWYYPLETPVDYSDLQYDISAGGDGSELVPLGEVLIVNYLVNDLGQETSYPVPAKPASAQAVAGTPAQATPLREIIYGINAADFVANANINFASAGTIRNFLEALKLATVITSYTMSDTPNADGDYTFTITK